MQSNILLGATKEKEKCERRDYTTTKVKLPHKPIFIKMEEEGCDRAKTTNPSHLITINPPLTATDHGYIHAKLTSFFPVPDF